MINAGGKRKLEAAQALELRCFMGAIIAARMAQTVAVIPI